jgi:TIR domain/SIR2-like domain
MANTIDTTMMIAELNDLFWEQLLIRMKLQKVIPVVGPGAITFGRGDDMLHPWIAQKVAAKCHLQFPAADLPKTLQQVVDEQRRGGFTYVEKSERLGLVHLYVFDLLTSPGVYPGVTLYRLTSIKDFQLFLTTSFDPLLARAVEVAQPAARPSDWVRAISSRDGFSDLPSNLGELPYACVYHLFGKIRKLPDCALWDDEMLAFLRVLDQHLRASGKLSAALHDSHLLFLGLSLDNWLTRFLIQVVKQKPLSELDHDQLYLSESQKAVDPNQIVSFFSRLTNQLCLIPISPRKFIAELARRWREQHPQSPDDDSIIRDAYRHAHRAPGCIFVSYASPDLKIACYVVKQLQDRSLLVWFDKQQLLPGQDREAELSDIIENTCGIFLSLISDNSASRLVGLNIKERNLAIERREQFADTAVFYIPMRIDEGEPLIPGSEPRRSKKLQAIRRPGGHLDDDFIEYLRKLQLDYCKSRGLTFTPPPP